jgi:hypothetical protein
VIYQCHPNDNRFTESFGPLYRTFSLDRLANLNLLMRAPELLTEENRYALSEYAAMLHFWRNPDRRPDNWIGFTSYRQMEKVHFTLQPQHLDGLREYDILTWGWLTVQTRNIGAHAEAYHPGIVATMARLLGHFGLAFPPEWSNCASAVFANYWLMSVRNFNEYMHWSCPLIQWMLANPEGDPFLTQKRQHENGIGYIMERLFIVWYNAHRKSVFDLVNQIPVK